MGGSVERALSLSFQTATFSNETVLFVPVGWTESNGWTHRIRTLLHTYNSVYGCLVCLPSDIAFTCHFSLSVRPKTARYHDRLLLPSLSPMYRAPGALQCDRNMHKVYDITPGETILSSNRVVSASGSRCQKVCQLASKAWDGRVKELKGGLQAAADASSALRFRF